jgi:IstB-like ATP binding protein
MLQSVAIPVGVGKTFMANALGHAAVRRRYSVIFCRTDVLLKKLLASRLDNSHDTEMRKLIGVDLLLLDDFALKAFDHLDTADIYELIVERHRAASTVVTSNREHAGAAGLDDLRSGRHHQTANAANPPKGGPITLAKAWPHQAGERQRGAACGEITSSRNYRIGLDRRDVPICGPTAAKRIGGPNRRYPAGRGDRRGHRSHHQGQRRPPSPSPIPPSRNHDPDQVAPPTRPRDVTQ